MAKNKQIQKVEAQAPAFNIEALISQAVAKDASPESLEKFLAMRKELKAEWAKEQFDKALAAFQGECPIIEKRKKVSFNTTKYSYAPLEDIVEQVKPLLAKHGFSYMFDTQTNGKMKVICKVKHAAGHSEIATFDMEIDTNAKMNVSQKYGSALTYAKRYAFCAAFGITVKEEDDDAVSVKKEEVIDIDQKSIAKINLAKTDEELVKVCHELRVAQPKNVKAILIHYNRRKDELVEEMNRSAEEALNK
jgi:ERF superfamily